MEQRTEYAACVMTSLDGTVGVVELARPDRGNAVNVRLCAELHDALDRMDADDEVAVVLLAGQGRNFCVGADLQEGFQGAGKPRSAAFEAFVARFGTAGGVPRDPGGVVALRLAAMRKPVVVAVHGAAVGVGASWLLPCDVRIIAESARVGFVFAKRGIAAESTASWLLPRVVGITRAAEWVLTGRLVPAQTLLAAGLATEVVADAEVREAALRVAREIAASTSRVAAGVARQLLWGMLSSASPVEAHEVESRVVWHAAGGADVAEGVASFLEKRLPEFPLRVPRDYPAYVPAWPAVDNR
ncbi:enoyl-CoA hydratase-related protein [Nocardioides daejeonensis]|uniref:enoyl-CoA hydratase-related protein n=1 Tax=Nocardioides daejeonensis TaxID=1046556 RepID=UPI0019501B37|nr:enoyl-CoA hydratase-related protein [Nocardioides daejeonensis]